MAMNMRSTRGANRSRLGGGRPIFEDYKPLCEWKHEDNAHILLYHLPGFVKEQIRILAESKGILRVHGQRLIGGNKWSRFQDEFSVAEDCNMSGIRAKFEGGILQIIMPKKIANPPPNTHHDDSAPHHHDHQQDQDQDQDHDHQQEHLQENPDHNLQTKPQENTSASDSMKPGAQMEEESNKHEENNNTSFLEDEDELVPNSMEKSGVLKDQNKQRNKVNHHVPRRLDEDRQLLVNMGVAVLVIVGLGAYITHSFASSI